MWLSNAVMVAVTAFLFGLAVWRAKGIPFEALKESGKTFLTMLPIIICAFVCEGLIKTIVPPSWIQKWLAVESGWRGIAIGCIAGALTLDQWSAYLHELGFEDIRITDQRHDLNAYATVSYTHL
ncbi:MAG: hypothetical protein N2116_03180, partial [Armatimonadetes bacterium]|nr:hypothetical protein [Armatimonadota bacterium]